MGDLPANHVYHKTIPKLVMSTVCELENGSFIVSCPIKNGGSFHGYVEAMAHLVR